MTSPLNTGTGDGKAMHKPTPDILTLDRAKLKTMPAQQLCQLGDAISTLSDVTDGLACRPCFSETGKTIFNDAGDIIAAVSDYLTTAAEAIKSEAVRRSEKPVTSADARWLAYTHIRYEARFLDHPSALAVVVAQALVVEENANG